MRHQTLISLSLLASAAAVPAGLEQTPLTGGGTALGGKTEASKPRKLSGQFLHITDLHPDPFFKYHSSTQHDDACHSGHGAAGYYGAETSACDSPFSLINATFDWIAENIVDQVDFVVWTGDSARHDNDENHPRTTKQVTSLNEYVASKFSQVFGGDNAVPVIPTFGNNDVLPHNVFFPGPNRWTRTYLDVWRDFIPEEQRHGFSSGGWFYVEAIPNHLAVFSLNSLYFFDSNSAVTGCAARSEPGYEQFDWLRVQLQFMRQRGMRAILIGHVPPARTDSKQSWDESCWQKYTLWMHQFRDVVVASLWGHMNTDHFLLHDSTEVDLSSLLADNVTSLRAEFIGDDMTVQSSTEYLTDLREQWSGLPHVQSLNERQSSKEREQLNAAIGGSFGERYSLSLVGPSVVPNYFPSLRIMSYDISGIDEASTVPNARTNRPAIDNVDLDESEFDVYELETHDLEESFAPEEESSSWPDWLPTIEKKKKKKNKHKFKTPKSPSKSSPPGPAYSVQSLSLLGYQQLFANLTHINNDFGADSSRWNPGKHADKDVPESKPSPRKFAFELEYDTRAKDDVYGLRDMTVRSYLDLAKRIGRYKAPKKSDLSLAGAPEHAEDAELEDEQGDKAVHENGKKKDKKKKGEKKKKKAKERAERNAPWLTFVRRAFVSARDDKDLQEDFGREFVPNSRLRNLQEDM